MDKNSARALIESLEGATIQGADHATLAQVIEDSLHPLLKEHIFELHYNHHGGRSRGNFDRDYELNREIVKFFNEIRHGGFSLSNLSQFQGLQTRLLQGQELERKKGIETDTGRLIGIVEDYITQIRPLISPERARALVRGEDKTLPARVYESDVTDIVRVSDTSSKQTIYQNYFKALMARAQLKQQLAFATTERQYLQRSFTHLNSPEVQRLDTFLHDKDPKYCSLVYAARYGEWRLQQLRSGIITINVVHRFE